MDNKLLLKKNKIYLFLIFYVASFLLLMICSKNSFLYGMNDWVDLNWYITMGRGINAGKVPYKDMFEQKGPILYFVFSIVSLFSNPYLGAFFLETITLSLLLYFSYKFARKFLNPYLSIFASIILGFLTVTTRSFVSGGGAVEEYALPILMWVVLCFYEFLDGKQFSKPRSFLIGFWIAMIFWSKFTIIFFPVVLLIVWLVCSLIKKDYKNLLTSILFIFLGFLFVSVIVLLIFVVAGGVRELFSVYFYDNLFRYTEYSKATLIKKLLAYLINSIAEVLLIFAGVLIYAIKYKKESIPFLAFSLIAMFVLLVIAKFEYYFLPNVIFAFFGVIMLLSLFDKFKFIKKEWISIMLCLVASLAIIGISFFASGNTSDIGKKKEDYVQYKIAQKIESFGLENPSLLCYTYDHGFYTICGIVPQDRFWATNNFTRESYPELFESYANSIKTQKNDFLIVNMSSLEDEKEILNSYTFVESFEVDENKGFALLIKNDLAYML